VSFTFFIDWATRRDGSTSVSSGDVVGTLDADTVLLAEVLERLHVGVVLVVHQEVDTVTPRPARVARIGAFNWIDYKRPQVAVVVEWAQAMVLGALLLQVVAKVLEHVLYVGGFLNFVDCYLVDHLSQL